MKKRKNAYLFVITTLFVLTFAICLNSKLIFADTMPQEEFTYKDVTYTKWFTADSSNANRGYVYFGMYPRTQYTDSNAGEEPYETLKALYNEYKSSSSNDNGWENALESGLFRLDNSLVLDDNNKYLLLYKDYIGNKLPLYFKFEPIKWRIIDYDETEHTLTLLTDEIIESRQFGTYINGLSRIFWGGDGNTESPLTGKEYPALRLYLNNYDSSEGYGSNDKKDNLAVSNLVYTEDFTADFYDRGFLEKTFTDNDIEKMVETKVKVFDTNNDGASIETVSDKVRLLTKKELEDATSPYGFTSNTLRLANMTKFANVGKGSTVASDDYYATDKIHYFTSSQYSSTSSNIYSVLTGGGFRDFANSGSRNNRGGVRPVIQIKLDDLTKVSGDGSFDNPYSFGYKLKIETNEVTGTDIAYYTPGENKIDIDLLPGNTIKGVYTSRDKTTRLDTPENPGVFTMPNNDYEVFVDVNVTPENALKLISGVNDGTIHDKHFVFQAMLSDAYIDAIDNASTTYDLSGIKNITDDKKWEIADAVYWNINDDWGYFYGQITTLEQYEEYIWNYYDALIVPFDDKYDMDDIYTWWDVSNDGYFSIMAYYFYKGSDPDKYDGRTILVRNRISDNDETHTLDEYPWNDTWREVNNIIFYNKVKLTTNEEDSYGFLLNEDVVKVDLTNLDTSGVKNMMAMFFNCPNLKEIIFPSFDTNDATSMEAMFAFDSSLTELDLSSFKINNGTSVAVDLSSENPSWSNVTFFYGCDSLSTIKLPQVLGDEIIIPLPGTDSWYLYDENFNSVGTGNVTNLVESGTNGAVYASTKLPYNFATNDLQMKSVLINLKEELNIDSLLSGKSDDIVSFVSNYVFKMRPAQGYTSGDQIKANVEYALNHIPTLSLSSDKTILSAGENATLTSVFTCDDSIKPLFKENNLYKKGSPSISILKDGTFPFVLNYSDTIFGTYFQEYLLDTSITTNPFVLKSNEIVISKKDNGGGSGGSSGGGGGGSGSAPKTPIEQPPVEEVLHSAYINGYEDNTFKPNQSITRAEFCKIVSCILGGYDQLSKEEIDKELSIFLDTKTEWYRPYIAHLTKLKVLNGYDDGTFKPNNQITRGEASKILALTFEIKEVNKNNAFLEEIKNEWFFEYADKLIKGGIINGYDDGTFMGYRSISRAETVAMINRSTNRTITKEISNSFKNPFKDVYSNDWFYKDIIEASVSHKESDLHEIVEVNSK